jgi:hypothetical protein
MSIEKSFPPKVGLVEKNVEIPTPRVIYTFPFKGMEVGDSFLVENISSSTVIKASQRFVEETVIEGVPNKKFIVRTVAANKIRCWRIA